MTARTSIALKACLSALLLFSAACPDDTSDAPAEGPTAPAPTSQPSAATQPKELTQPSAQQLPVSEDFEAEAETAIDARTYKKELDALARQIDQEGTN